ncbi:GNAT family N-acetyltransferase [Thioclava atlantica]|uniref:Acetyltransferase n=1 Tax=Thioclava atlantica TaxID=1317124 RepID=A0A085TYD5_9RHOB|nr:GNAT family N-acetyltransferase [Thioclava atlantica]KFE35732.1 acetyltransferase [Thioclava atlantica]
MTVLSVDIPVLTTERLVLREPRETDFERHLAFLETERTHNDGPEVSRAAAWRKFSGRVGEWLLHGFGYWTLEMRDSGAIAGTVGFLTRGGDTPDLGWVVYEGYEGRGLAYEAAMAARRHAAQAMNMHSVISLVPPGNMRSRKLAERMGATPEREIALEGHPCVIYRHPERCVQ